MALLNILFAATILFPVDGYVRVDNYQHSVYIQKERNGIFKQASSITFLEPAIYDFMSVDTETEVDGVSQRVLPECIENLNGTDDRQPCYSCEDVNNWDNL
ncbi:uncharacterized protein LOC134709332 isoform X2 [Mytilus trossulus]|uniref:uncharacterized protein LOC134709332 isoform X2 n=1 Tax=Mytilus trossulus TaxID=6551 RepID=UPI0030052FAA